MRQRMIRTAALAAAWVPFLLLWVALTMQYGGVTVGGALERAAVTIGCAALLALPVSAYCRRTPWPQRIRVGFYAGHLFAAALYAALWVLSQYLFDWVANGIPLQRSMAMGSRVIGWQFLMGIWLYGVIAGVSYAMDAQRRALDNERRALKAEASLAAARLDALRSRLHPHFLFNALHTVAALVRQDVAQAENAIEKLGAILRYSLEEGGGETVSFAEEWEFTRRYLEFEQLRYGARLQVATTIDPATLQCATPSFALQTLVENAVHHAIARRPTGGKIEITASAQRARLHVRVRDDGDNGLPSSESGSRYGLAALRERLQAVYGEGAELALARNDDGFEAAFTVPCRAWSEQHDDE